jgi:hypothetical protein
MVSRHSWRWLESSILCMGMESSSRGTMGAAIFPVEWMLSLSFHKQVDGLVQ